MWPSRVAAAGSLIAVGVLLAVIVFGSKDKSGHKAPTTSKPASLAPVKTVHKPGTLSVPVLAYRVINAAPPQSSGSPSVYVPTNEFSAQMSALKAAGWRAVTLNQLRAYWTRGTPLGTAKPIVITFDRGYGSQYVNALPVLKKLGWVAVENLEVNGLSPTDGGLTDAQVKGLIAAGWELDTQGVSQSDLTALSTGQLQTEVATARQTLRTRYNVPVNWFSYPTGAYNAGVVTAVQGAGFRGATTLVAGWANPKGDRYRLPRMLVVGGTSPTALLSQITAAQTATAPPDSSPGTGTT